MVLSVAGARAAQLVMFEQAGCVWCEAFDSQIGSIYNNTEDGLRAPLRRVAIDKPLPPDLSFIQVERLTPLFVLVDKGHEIGRIRGYGGRDMFWTQLNTLMLKLDRYEPDVERAQRNQTVAHANG
jgi:thioredoxin-related protein